VWLLQGLRHSSSKVVGVMAGSSSWQQLVLLLVQPWQQCCQVSSGSSRVVQQGAKRLVLPEARPLHLGHHHQ
jgi:hypothetical protein